MLEETSPRIKEVPGALIPLWDHQLAMLKRAMVIESSILGTGMSPPYGVFSDPPGSGKSNVVLSLILMDKYMERIAEKHFGGKSAKKLTGTNLLVIPHNIHTQWVDNITSFAGSAITYKTFIEYADISSLYFAGHDAFQYDLLVTTSLYYDVIASTIQSLNLNVRRVFFDEIDTIKLSIKHMIPANVTWFISASVSRLFNDDGAFVVNQMYQGDAVKNVQQEAYTLSLETLLHHEVRCLESFIAQSVNIPLLREQQIKCPNMYIDSILYNILSPDQLLAINACDYAPLRDPAFPCTVRDDRDALVVYMNNVLRQIGDCDKRQSALADFVSKKQNVQIPEVQDMVTVIRGEIKDLDGEKKKLTFASKRGYMLMNNNGICNNCAAECPTYTKGDTCQCVRCLKCVQDTCGPCNNRGMTVLSEASPRPKIASLKKLITDILVNPEAKILVFSSHTSIFTEIVRHLDATNTVFKELDGGNVATIDRCIKSYKEGDTSVMLVHSMLFGSGSNLENTTDLIFVHKMEESLATQVIGRAQRPGRSTRLNVWYMCHTNEIS